MASKTARTDSHSPLNLITEDYRYAGSYDSSPTAGMQISIGQFGEKSVAYGPEKAQQLAMRKLLASSTESRDDGRCDHCGAWIRYVAVLMHIPTQQHIAVGETCLDNRFSLATADFQKMRKAAELDRQQQRIQKAVAEFVAANTDLAWMAEKQTPEPWSGNNFLVDVACKLRAYGSLSEAQVAAVRKAMPRQIEWAAERAAKQAEREQAEASRLHSYAPEGRVEIVGTIISVKEQDGYMPGTSEYKALVLADAGYKVYGTASYAFTNYTSDDGSECYRKFSDLRGMRVKMVATVKPSDKDPEFGFYSRPSKVQVACATCEEVK